MWHDEVDFQDRPDGGLSFFRTYNSIFWNAVQTHLLGTRWTTEYDSGLRPVIASTTYSDQQCYKRSDNNKIFCEVAGDLNATLLSAAAIQVTRGDGKNYVFSSNNGVYVGAADTVDRLSAIYATDNSVTGFRYEDGRTGAIETYDTAGLLLTITSAKGAARRLTYSNGSSNDTSVGRYPASAPVCTGPADPSSVLPAKYLLCVTDDWGRQLNFAYDAVGRVKAMTDPSGKTSLYEYDGVTGGCSAAAAASGSLACKANNLTKLTHPDGTARQYFYNESTNINGGTACSYVTPVGNGFGHLLYSMTGLVDEKGVRYITWGYDCNGYATSSQLAGGVEKVGVVNSFSSTTPELITSNQVTTYLGNPASPQTAISTFTPKLILDDYKNSAISTLCSVCGTTASRTFDVNGNLSTVSDFLGNVTKFTYDLSRNLETSRTEGYGSTAARTTTTTWHATLRVRTGIAEPKRITTFTYDDHGNVLTRTVQATGDSTGVAGFGAIPVGAARVWRYEYNQYGQLTKKTGPRTDVADVTTYGYDTKGNLATVTDAMGRATTLSGYDGNGRVGSVLEPNGILTQFTYTVGGNLASRTVSTGGSPETTSYEYDPIGQLTKVTNPDGSGFTYGYDDAHRLLSIGDILGNSVVYTLDLTGNRLNEQIKDPNGVLARQISRVFNTLNQMISVTGADQ
jgi:YD repeat-containing protein